MSTTHQLLQVIIFHLIPDPLRFTCPKFGLNGSFQDVDVNVNYLAVNINVNFIGTGENVNLLGDSPSGKNPPDKVSN